MSEIVLELSLSRSSGVLAGIVATLAQNGLELKSQKLDRDLAARQGAAGWLTIHATGEAPDPEALARRMASARGVDRVMRIEIDGIESGAVPVADPGRPDEAGQPSSARVPAGEPVELSGDADTPQAETGAPAPPADRTSGPLLESEPFLEPDPEPETEPEPAPESGRRTPPPPAPPPGSLPPLLVEDEDEPDGEPLKEREGSTESGTADEETEGTNIPAPEFGETADEDLARALGDSVPAAAPATADAPDPLPEHPDRTEPGTDPAATDAATNAATNAATDAAADAGRQPEQSGDPRPAPGNGNKPSKKSLRRRRRRWR